MPTSLPTSLPIQLSSKLVDETELPIGQGVIWTVAVWAIALLFFAAIANVGADPGSMDPFQLIATF
jgi:hypothetical protein